MQRAAAQQQQQQQPSQDEGPTVVCLSSDDEEGGEGKAAAVPAAAGEGGEGAAGGRRRSERQATAPPNPNKESVMFAVSCCVARFWPRALVPFLSPAVFPRGLPAPRLYWQSGLSALLTPRAHGCRFASLSSCAQGARMRYPPEGGKSCVEVTAKDFDRLEDGEFLNDTCIDFYLK